MFGALAFHIFYAINWIITLLPLRILYIFSDLLFLGFYYFPTYRKKVVLSNLRNSFPEKSEKEIKIIAYRFYRHLADLFVETLKLTHLSKKQLMKRMRLTNPELLEELYHNDRDVLGVLGHYNNWEWLQSMNYYTSLQNVSIYKPLQNKRFDRFMYKLRHKNGMILTPMSSIIREIIRLRGEKKRSLFGFITDQTPPRNELKYWTTFLNQDTPVYQGIEKIAAKYDMAVVWFSTDKVKRGYYTVTAEMLYEHTKGLHEHEITESHVRKLEQNILKNPEYWIWSHRRWKHKKAI
jgi:Kdo2-lipid IVA lauroyltransferase/acyltransferase